MSFSMNEGGDDAPVSDINVTPLVDVMLVLLIVFMITMPVLTHSIQIQLPTASESADAKDETKPKEPMWLSVDDSGRYFIDRSSTPTAKRKPPRPPSPRPLPPTPKSYWRWTPPKTWTTAQSSRPSTWPKKPKSKKSASTPK